MSERRSARIHSSAVVSPEAELADDVVIGPYAVLEGKVRLGPGCVIRPFAHLCGPLVMGRGNTVYSGAVLGEQPQHLKYAGEPTSLEVGDGNVFREHVTVHRGTTHSHTTRIGSHNFFMAGSHVAHDCRVGDRCILANGAVLGGHCVVEDGAYLSGHACVHQFVRIGRLALLSGVSATTKDIPPFVVVQEINGVAGVNVVGMRRAGLSGQQIDGVRRAYQLLYRSGHVLPVALALVERDLGHLEAVAELSTFIRRSARGISLKRSRHAEADAA